MSAQINIEDITPIKWSQWGTASAIGGALGVHASTVSRAARSGQPIQQAGGHDRRVRSTKIEAGSPERKAHPRASKLYSVELLEGDPGFEGGEAKIVDLATVEQTAPVAKQVTHDIADALLIEPTMELPPLSWRHRIDIMLKKVARVRGIANHDSEAHRQLRSDLYDYWLIRMRSDIRKACERYKAEHKIKTVSTIEYMERVGKCEALYTVGWELWGAEIKGGGK